MATDAAAQPPSEDDPLLQQLLFTVSAASGYSIAEPTRDVAFAREDTAAQLSFLARVNSKPARWIAIERRRTLYPGTVPAIADHLSAFEHSSHRLKGTIMPMVLAEEISSGARDQLRELGIGYFDATGSLFLKRDGWLLNIGADVTLPPVSSAKVRRPTSLFTETREQILLALLHNANEWHTGAELAASTQTSTFTVSTLLQELEAQGWVESTGTGPARRRRLVQPGQLLDAWAEHWPHRKEERTRWFAYAQYRDEFMPTFTAKLHGHKLRWGFTGECAANSMSPWLTNIGQIDLVMAPGAVQHIAQLLGLKQADQGGNVIIHGRTGAPLSFISPFGPTRYPLVSPFIQYLDLLDGKGRHAELAEHFRSTVLKV